MDLIHKLLWATGVVVWLSYGFAIIVVLIGCYNRRKEGYSAADRRSDEALIRHGIGERERQRKESSDE